MRSLDREDPASRCCVGAFQKFPKGLKCVERREAGRGAGVHAPQAEFTFRTYCLSASLPLGLLQGNPSSWKNSRNPCCQGSFQRIANLSVSSRRKLHQAQPLVQHARLLAGRRGRGAGNFASRLAVSQQRQGRRAAAPVALPRCYERLPRKYVCGVVPSIVRNISMKALTLS
jgi:hypothetical protein